MQKTWMVAVLSLLVAAGSGCEKKPAESQGTRTLKDTQNESGMYAESRWDPDRDPRARRGRQRGRRGPAAVKGPERAGAHILIAYKGSAARKPGITRTKEEARAFAKKLSEQLKKHPEQFAEMAKKHSDGPTGRRGGLLGVWHKGRMVPAFDNAIDGLKVNEISGVVETRFGFHVIKRLDTQYAGRHILIAYKGAMKAKPDITRTKEQAKAEAKRLCGEAAKDPSKFAELAKKYSNGPSGPRGGSLGIWKPGRMVPAFQSAVENLPLGGITKEPVETPFGFHVIKREDPKHMK